MTSGLRAWLAYQPCAGCHGPQGRGVGELGPALLEGGSTREALRALLVRQDHPSMGRAMSEPVRRELLAYLAELRGQDLPSERDYREALWALDEQVEPTP